MSAILNYIYDPLCGWCYGASKLVDAADCMAGIELALNAGGLFPQPTRLPENMRSYIQQADARIAAMNGVGFGEAYLKELLHDPELILDSRPPIAAILAARALDPAKELDMLRALQQAHYVAGRHIVQPGVLSDIAETLGFDGEKFEAAYAAAPVDAHLADTRRLMAAVGAGGFPTFVLKANDRLLPVPHNQFAGNAGGFAAWLEAAADQVAAAAG